MASKANKAKIKAATRQYVRDAKGRFSEVAGSRLKDATDEF